MGEKVIETEKGADMDDQTWAQQRNGMIDGRVSKMVNGGGSRTQPRKVNGGLCGDAPVS